MSKAFTREGEAPEEELEIEPRVPQGTKNNITRATNARVKWELRARVEVERPEIVKTVAWAAANGDRSENADYLYGKKRLGQIDSRIRFLTKRIDAAVGVDPAAPPPG